MRTCIIGALLFFSLTACQDEAEKNLARAQRTYDRLQVGMSHKDACWFSGASCQTERDEWTYSMDVGRSFSKKEYIVFLTIHEGKLTQVQIIKPRYVDGHRQGSEGDIVATKGGP